ncbi:MAG: hypothetical protein HQL31_05235, partial [Planctomycetes bacterium]|nr:hypothetical protein [Planctomycetota bacterium]
GNRDADCWRDRPVITNMVLRKPTLPELASIQTRTRLAYDSLAMYLAVDMDEPQPLGIVKELHENGDSLWKDDSVELYLAKGLKRNTFFKFIINAQGAKTEDRWTLGPHGLTVEEWGTGTEWEAKTRIGESSWTLEIAIPWSDLDSLPPSPGDVWTFEIIRFRRAGGPEEEEFSSWTFGAVYDRPDKFGTIVFSDRSSETESLLINRLAPVFGDPFTVFKEKGLLAYTGYETLKTQQIQAIRSQIVKIERCFRALSGTLGNNSFKQLNKLGLLYEKTFEDASKLPAGHHCVTTLDALSAHLEDLLWELRFHSLNEMSMDAGQAP